MFLPPPQACATRFSARSFQSQAAGIMWLACIVVFIVLRSDSAWAFESDTSQHRWQFRSEVGLEGQAYVTGKGGMRIEVECGNGGGPAITLVAPTPDMLAWGRGTKIISLLFKIDDEPFYEDFECHPDGMSCGRFGFPSADLMMSMRKGARMVVQYSDSFQTEFTLNGSNRTISQLSSCLSFPPSK